MVFCLPVLHRQIDTNCPIHFLYWSHVLTLMCYVRWKLELRIVYTLNSNTAKASKSKWSSCWYGPVFERSLCPLGQVLFISLMKSKFLGITWRMLSLEKFIFFLWESRWKTWSLRLGVESQQDQGLILMLRLRPSQNLKWWTVLLSEVRNPIHVYLSDTPYYCCFLIHYWKMSLSYSSDVSMSEFLYNYLLG